MPVITMPSMASRIHKASEQNWRWILYAVHSSAPSAALSGALHSSLNVSELIPLSTRFRLFLSRRCSPIPHSLFLAISSVSPLFPLSLAEERSRGFRLVPGPKPRCYHTPGISWCRPKLAGAHGVDKTPWLLPRLQQCCGVGRDPPPSSRRAPLILMGFT